MKSNLCLIQSIYQKATNQWPLNPIKLFDYINGRKTINFVSIDFGFITELDLANNNEQKALSIGVFAFEIDIRMAKVFEYEI